MKIRIGLAQVDPALGLVDRNLDLHLEQAERAAAEIDLLLFPELSLTGYLLKDMVPEIARPWPDPLFAPLLKATESGMDLVFGFVERSEDGRCFNSQAYLSGGALVHLHRKAYLPTYGMFDEHRYFAAGESLHAFDTRFGRLAMLICEDLWHPSLPYLAFMDGALGLLVPSASPLRGMEGSDGGELPSNAAFWTDLLSSHARQYAGFMAFCNRSGVEDGSSYWGGSRLLGADGRALATGPQHEPALVTGAVDLDALARQRRGFSLLRDERPEFTFRNLERILRRRAGRCDENEEA